MKEPSSRYYQPRNLLCRWLARVQCDVDGLEHVPAAGPAIVIMNHTGWEEILLAMLAIPRRLRIVGMHDLIHLDDERSRARIFDTGYAAGMGSMQRRLLVLLGTRFGARIRQLAGEFGYIPARVFSPMWHPVLGGNGIPAIVRALEAGDVVLIFPEGGYRRGGVMTPFKRGLGLIVRLLQRRGIRVPIIPVAQHTAGCLSITLKNRFVPRLSIGAPIVFDVDTWSPAAFDAFAARHLQDQVNAQLLRAWPDAPAQTYAAQESGARGHDDRGQRVRATRRVESRTDPADHGAPRR